MPFWQFCRGVTGSVTPHSCFKCQHLSTFQEMTEPVTFPQAAQNSSFIRFLFNIFQHLGGGVLPPPSESRFVIDFRGVCFGHPFYSFLSERQSDFTTPLNPVKNVRVHHFSSFLIKVAFPDLWELAHFCAGWTSTLKRGPGLGFHLSYIFVRKLFVGGLLLVFWNLPQLLHPVHRHLLAFVIETIKGCG